MYVGDGYGREGVGLALGFSWSPINFITESESTETTGHAGLLY